MKRIAILTAGGDTPALNATICGAATYANQRKIELIGLMCGFDALFHPQVPHVELNPLFCNIPELDPTHGGSILGASRRYVTADDREGLQAICARIELLQLDGLICIGGDGTMNGLRPLCGLLPTVLAPKTIDNDLGLNFPGEPDTWIRRDNPHASEGYRYERDRLSACYQNELRLDQMVNYVTPGFATAVFVSASGVERVRTTAESHRRIAIIEVMGRDSGFIALGAAYGQPDIILIPEHPVDLPPLVERVKSIYERQQNVVIVCGEGIVDTAGRELGASETTACDPAGNIVLSGAAERLGSLLIEHIGDEFFRGVARIDSAKRAIFTRKIGHTQRGGRPLLFDRYLATQLGGKAVEMLLQGQNEAVAVVCYDNDNGFTVGSIPGNGLRDNWGVIHARQVHPSFYDPQRLHVSEAGARYLMPIFGNAIGADDVEYVRQSMFDSGKLFHKYHSINRDIAKRIRYVGP